MHATTFPITSSDTSLNHIVKEAMQLAQKIGLFAPSPTNIEKIVQLSGTEPPIPLADGPGGGW